MVKRAIPSVLGGNHKQGGEGGSQPNLSSHVAGSDHDAKELSQGQLRLEGQQLTKGGVDARNVLIQRRAAPPVDGKYN